MTWHSLLHGPEAWLGLAIWGIGAMCGIAASWAAIEIAEKREEARSREPVESDLDRSDECGSGFAPRGPSESERERQG